MNTLSGRSIHSSTMNYVEKVAHSNRSWANRTPRLMGTNILAIGTAVTTAFKELLKLTLVQPVGILANGGLRTVRVITWSHLGESALKQLPNAKDWMRSVVKTVLLTASTLLSLMAAVGSLISSKPSQWNAAVQYKAGLYAHKKIQDIIIDEPVLNPPMGVTPPSRPITPPPTQPTSEVDSSDSSTDSIEFPAQPAASVVPADNNYVFTPSATPPPPGTRDLFAAKFKDQIDSENLQKLLIAGKSLLVEFYKSEDIEKTISGLNQLTDVEVEEKIASLLWYLMYRASLENKDFSEGAFLLFDPDHKIARILEGLTVCYKRISSHLHGQNTESHMGIDINDPRVKLPHHKAHILIIPVIQENENSKWVYLKPENYGVRGAAANIGHAYEYIFSVGRKVAPGWFGSDDEPGMRKERVPKDMLREFDRLLANDERKADLMKQASIHGVKFMYQHAIERSGNDFYIFANKLKNQHGDKIHFVTGNEVVITNPLAHSIIQS